jgi:hypothetical protein
MYARNLTQRNGMERLWSDGPTDEVAALYVFVSVASKRLSVRVRRLESTVRRHRASVDSKAVTSGTKVEVKHSWFGKEYQDRGAQSDESQRKRRPQAPPQRTSTKAQRVRSHSAERDFVTYAECVAVSTQSDRILLRLRGAKNNAGPGAAQNVTTEQQPEKKPSERREIHGNYN